MLAKVPHDSGHLQAEIPAVHAISESASCDRYPAEPVSSYTAAVHELDVAVDIDETPYLPTCSGSSPDDSAPFT